MNSTSLHLGDGVCLISEEYPQWDGVCYDGFTQYYLSYGKVYIELSKTEYDAWKQFKGINAREIFNKKLMEAIEL